MPVINRIASFHKDMTGWRHDIHSHPETAFEKYGPPTSSQKS